MTSIKDKLAAFHAAIDTIANPRGAITMPKTIMFNTGRKYSQFGQRITATLHDDGVVTFFDHDRQIDGWFKLGRYCSFNQTEVMHWYDAGKTDGNPRSWADGMLRGGCNRVWEPDLKDRVG
jgi:hypothetical protein